MKRILVLGLLAIGCGIAQPVHVEPTSADYKKTLARISSNINMHVLPMLKQLRDEDIAASQSYTLRLKAPRHIPEWWEQKIGLMEDTAGLASTVGAK